MSLLTLQWANYYVSKGWSVIPLTPGQKTPALQAGEVVKYRKTLPTHTELVNWFEDTEANIGIITGNNGPVVVDVDSAEGIKALNNATNNTKFDTPLVKTARGYHLYFKSNTDLGNRAHFIHDCDLRATGGYVVAPPSVNGTGKPYKWLREPSTCGFQELPTEILDKVDTKEPIFTEEKPVTFESGLRDESLYSVAVALYKGGLPISSAYATVEGLASQCDPPFSKEEARKKVDSAYKNLPSERNLIEEVGEWIEDSQGIFRITDLFNTLKASKKDQRYIRTRLGQLVTRGEVERVPSRGNGFYRRIITELTPIDYKNAVDEPCFDITWPSAFGFHSMFNMYPGNIGIVAGSPNAGKTAMMLNLIVNNQHKYPVNYFTCELTDAELKARLSFFEDRDPSQFNFNAYELSNSFSDQIQQNALNIIDYWQPSEEGAFYRIGDDLDKIHKKLDGTGLAIVCVQKKRDAELGRGAEFGMERPRVYLSMDFQKIKMVKIKSPVVGADPNGREYSFKLINGCEFVEVEETTDD